MKKKIIMLLCVFVVIGIAIFLCGFKFLNAEGLETKEEIQFEDNTPEQEKPSFTSRVDEWFDENLSDFLSGISVAISGVFVSVIIPFLKKKMTNVSTEIKTNSNSQDAVVNVVNQMIDKYNEVENKLAELDAKEATRDVLQTQLCVCQKAILEILTTVYNNSKNIPQATKDMVNLQYVKVLKIENDTTEALKANGGD